jgi:hypothetical protein
MIQEETQSKDYRKFSLKEGSPLRDRIYIQAFSSLHTEWLQTPRVLAIYIINTDKELVIQ